MSKIEGIDMYVCDACGKKHVRHQNNIYKMIYKKRTRHFCCYSCYSKIIRLKEDQKFDEIDKIFKEHKATRAGYHN